jgi:thiol:disulfide interchange protein DsbD
MKKLLFVASLFSISLCSAHSQVFDPVHWKYSSKNITDNIYELVFVATIDKGWHMYGLNIPENGPVATSFFFNNNQQIEYLNQIKPTTWPEIKYDATFEMNVELFSYQVEFTRRVKILSGKQIVIEGSIEFMACDNSRCLPPKEEEFSFTLLPEQSASKLPDENRTLDHAEGAMARKERSVLTQPLINQMNEDNATIASIDTASGNTQLSETSESLPEERTIDLWRLFIKSLLGGFLVIITPCVYPIIPLTISYFSRKSVSRFRTVFNAVTFGLSIIIIYTFIGLLSGLFRIDLTRTIANHWIPNLIFLLIFLALAASFFGMFEIVLPGSLANRIEKQADKGGILGPFFMALATAIISFSCTGPIAGLVLGNALRGDIVTPVIGMFGFSLTFALPFTLLAIFPGMTSRLPKSGGWLNSVKIVIAFIILAFSLMFLGNLRLSFITRDVILALAIAIFILLGVYLLGRMKFPHEQEIAHVNFFRVILAILSFSIAIYLVPGLFGASLKKLSPFLPDISTLNLNLADYKTTRENTPHNPQSLCTENPRYADKFHLPYNLKGYFDYQEGLACARLLDKPVLIDFVGEICKNCKKMYAEVWSDEKVLKILREKFIIVAMYTDSRIELPESEWIVSSLNGRTLKTLGKINNNLQIEKFNSNALPLYVIVDPSGKQISDLYFYNPDSQKFIDFLNQGLQNFDHTKGQHYPVFQESLIQLE